MAECINSKLQQKTTAKLCFGWNSPLNYHEVGPTPSYIMSACFNQPISFQIWLVSQCSLCYTSPMLQALSFTSVDVNRWFLYVYRK